MNNMLIYILAHDSSYKEYIEDMICIATTDFQKILDYLTFDRLYRNNYELFFCKDGDIEDGYSIYAKTNMGNQLREYPPAILWENKKVLNELVEKIDIWSANIESQLEEKRRKEKEEKDKEQEEKDRALYEKLKAKFES